MESVIVEIELDPAQLEQVLGEIAELRAEVARLNAVVQEMRIQLVTSERRANWAA